MGCYASKHHASHGAADNDAHRRRQTATRQGWSVYGLPQDRVLQGAEQGSAHEQAYGMGDKNEWGFLSITPETRDERLEQEACAEAH
jgi:hypothetical protein